MFLRQVPIYRQQILFQIQLDGIPLKSHRRHRKISNSHFIDLFIFSSILNHWVVFYIFYSLFERQPAFSHLQVSTTYFRLVEHLGYAPQHKVFLFSWPRYSIFTNLCCGDIFHLNILCQNHGITGYNYSFISYYTTGIISRWQMS